MKSIIKNIALAVSVVILFGCASHKGIEDQVVYKVANGNQVYRAAWFDNIHSQKEFSDRYQNIVYYLSSYPVSDSQRDKVYLLLAEMISYAYADYAGYWDSMLKHDGRNIFQNHDLFEMDRLNYPKLELNLSQSKYETHDKNPVKSAFEDFNFSRERMRKGQPAIGPDGKEIVLCALLPVPNGALYELSQIDAERLIRRMPKNAQIGIKCNNLVGSSYWIERRNQFIDRYGIERKAEDTIILP